MNVKSNGGVEPKASTDNLFPTLITEQGLPKLGHVYMYVGMLNPDK